ncbi:hypothetical protein [Nocardia asteroides]|uniref:hypothetical protein n=1 Tax=Nocardia asteroides TaxID=1824 RepID=UPI00364FBBBB
MTVETEWINAGAAWRASLTPIGAEPTATQTSQPRVLDFAGMTPAAAARAYSRVLSQRGLTAQAVGIAKPTAQFAKDQSPSAGTHGPVQVVDPIADEPKIDYGGHNYAGGMPPPKPQPEVPAQTTPPPAVTQPQQSTTPPPSTGGQPGEVPVESSPIPAQPSDPKSSKPLFDRPDISGRKEGDRWTEVRDGFTHTYTIPVGNGNKSVDHEVSRDGVLVGTSRVAYGENGGAQQWVDVVGSASLYAEQASSASNQYTQVFNAGTSTAGNPDSVFGTLPDLATTFPLVENGITVGSLHSVEIPGSGPGLYGNKYVDHRGNVSIWRTNESEHGPLVTNQIANIDSRGYGWYTPAPAYGRRWEIAPKPDGTSILSNIETTPQGQHFTVWDPAANTRTERFHSSTPGVSGYLLSQHADGTKSIVGDDGSRLVVDELGRIISSQPATVVPAPEQSPKQPDLKSNWQKFTEFADDVGTGFGSAYDDTKKGIAGLLGQDGSLKEAWLGLATSGVGVGIGLAITAIDVGEIAIGRGSWSRLGNDVLGTGNELSIFAIGADWTQFDKEPGETIGRALFGTMLLFGPKALNNAAGKLPPPAAVSTAINNATTAFGRSGLSLGAPALAATNGISFPGAARTVGPASFASDTGRASAGSGTPRASGSGPNASVPATPTNRRANAAPLLPAEVVNAGTRNSVDQPNRNGPSIPSHAGVGRDTRTASVSEFAEVTTAVTARTETISEPTPVTAVLPARLQATAPTIPSADRAASAHYSDAHRRLANYSLPSHAGGTAILSTAQRRQLRNPYGRNGQYRPFQLEPHTRYEYAEGANSTVVITDANGSPTYIETWASRNVSGTTSGDVRANPILRDLLPNVVYRVNGDFWLRVDAHGRVVEGYNPAVGIVPAEMRTRNQDYQSSFNQRRGEVSGSFLEAGHTFRVQWGSPYEHGFYTPQRKSVNQSPGAYYRLEEEISQLLASSPSGTRAEVSVYIEYGAPPTGMPRLGWRPRGDERVPWIYHTRYRLVGSPTWSDINSVINR